MMNLILISNKPKEITSALALGIGRIMIDLEKETKIVRQQGKGLFLSDHTLHDLSICSELTEKNCFVVRINSIHSRSAEEIGIICSNSKVQYLMLPYFTSLGEIDFFFQHLPPNIKSILLFESKQSVDLLPQIITRYQVDEVFFGLNDLSLSLNNSSIFDVFKDEDFLAIVKLVGSSGIPFGFGGIGNMLLDNLPVPPEEFLLFQLCMGCTTGLLSRNFRSIFLESNWESVLQHNMRIIRRNNDLILGFTETDKIKIINSFKERVAQLTN